MYEAAVNVAESKTDGEVHSNIRALVAMLYVPESSHTLYTIQGEREFARFQQLILDSALYGPLIHARLLSYNNARSEHSEAPINMPCCDQGLCNGRFMAAPSAFDELIRFCQMCNIKIRYISSDD